MKKIRTVVLFVFIICSVAIASGCAHSHKFGEWTEVTSATCTTEGLQERVCKCGEKESEVIPMVPHVFSEATVFAPKTCEVCGATEGEPLGKSISIGQEVTSELHKFVVKEAYYHEGKFSVTKGSLTTELMEDKRYIIKLSFTNLGTDGFAWGNERGIEDIQLLYDNKFHYDGKFSFLTRSSALPPLDTGDIYILFSVPSIVGTDVDSSLIATFTIDGVVYTFRIR